MYIKLKGKVFHHWLLMGKNGEVMATSETYYSRGNCLRAAKKLSRVLDIELVDKK